jgi:hypothetical protein
MHFCAKVMAIFQAEHAARCHISYWRVELKSDTWFERALAMNWRKQLATGVVVAVVIVQGIVLPFVVKGGPPGDFRTIYTQTLGLFYGQDIYAGTNPYLPGTYVLMSWQCLFSLSSAWLVWRLAGLGILICTAYWGHRHLSRHLGYPLAVLSLANIMMLAGFSPKSGNPGNIAAILAVLGFLLECENRRITGGLAFGLATALKWSLGVPFIVLLFLARRWRGGLVAISVWAILNVLGAAVYLAHGFSLEQLVTGVAAGVWQVGGYGDHGFERWFAAHNVYRVQLLNVTPVLHSFKVPHSVANTLSSAGALVFGLLSCFVALRSKNLLFACAAVAPAMLLFTYHRFYDSAILAFPVMLAWLAAKERPILGGTVIILSLAFFLNVSNILLVLSGNPAWLDQWWPWRYLLGPHHVYFLVGILLTTTCVVLTSGRRQGTHIASLISETCDTMPDG